MPMSEAQLETWTNLPASTRFQDKHEDIRKALAAYGHWPDDIGERDIYLQGSYGNATYIRAESDVDLVVELTRPFISNLNRLTPTEIEQYHRETSNHRYTWQMFREDVLEALRSYFGSDRIDDTGNKSIKVLPTAGNSLYADVVVCLRYMDWVRFPSWAEGRLWYGITFYHRTTGRQIVNYPKRHRENGEEKNGRASQYKATVRIFKCLKRAMVDGGVIGKYLAPSYFVECLLWSAPDGLFSSNRRQTLEGILVWYAGLTTLQKSGLMCGNGLVNLFGETQEQWKVLSADEFMLKASQYYQSN